jgi:hypothetical protein
MVLPLAGDLIIVAVDLLFLQKAVTLGTEVHEHGLKAGLDAGDHTFVNAAVKDFPSGTFDVKLF